MPWTRLIVKTRPTVLTRSELGAMLAGAVLTGAAITRRLIVSARMINGAVLHEPTDDTALDPETGTVRSLQAADIIVLDDAVAQLWNPEHLERLARTYWATLTRFTLGLVRVAYTEDERFVYLLFRPIRLLSFRAPEYEMDECCGIVRWRIKQGLLVDRQGHDGNGYLELSVRRFDYSDWERTRLRIQVEVANFYPAVATYLGRWLYTQTQSRIHVVVCHFFLRQLVRRDLDISPVGRFAGPHSIDEAPDPVPAATELDVPAVDPTPD